MCTGTRQLQNKDTCVIASHYLEDTFEENFFIIDCAQVLSFVSGIVIRDDIQINNV